MFFSLRDCARRVFPELCRGESDTLRGVEPAALCVSLVAVTHQGGTQRSDKCGVLLLIQYHNAFV
jgi:hypothetical protein